MKNSISVTRLTRAVGPIARGIFVAAILCGTSTAFAWEIYTVAPIDTLGGSRNFATDISDTGYVTGNSRKASADDSLFPYVWKEGVVKEIPLIPSVTETFGRGFAVNNAGVIVGESGYSKPFLYNSATNTLVDLGSLPGGSGGVANDINNAGVVVGAASNGQTVRAFVTDGDGTYDGTLVDLGTPLGTSDSYARAYAISDTGLIAGVARNASDTASEPTIWRPNGKAGYTPVTISAPPEETVFGEFYAITNDGRAVGRYLDPDTGDTRAFFYNGTTSIALPLLENQPKRDNARAFDLNAAGLIVGMISDFDNFPFFGAGGTAVLWEDGEVVDLNTLIPEASDWTLLSAEAINSQGQIVGFGKLDGNTRAFLLTPVAVPAPPATLMAGLLLIGALAMARRRRRRR